MCGEQCKSTAVDIIEQMINSNAPLILHITAIPRQDDVKGVTFLEAQRLLSYVLSTCDWLQRPEDRGLGELVLDDVLGLDADSTNRVLDTLKAGGYRGFPALPLAPRQLKAWNAILETIQNMNADVKVLIQTIIDRVRDPSQRERDPGYQSVITAEMLAAKEKSMKQALH